MNERERLMKVMETENMNAKQFAAEVGIQPGTISNILSGRNNPSLDVLQRVLNRFRTLSSDWLVLGIGQMYRLNGEMPAGALFDIRPQEPSSLDYEEDSLPQMTSISKQEPPSVSKKEQPSVATPATNRREIQRILIFYTDGTFEER